jgi:FAD synthetase
MVKRILVMGSFDIIHPGHIFLLKEAAKLGDVYVIVGRDSTITRVKKQPPILPENERLELIQAIRYVKFATLGNEGTDFLAKPLELKPDIILLGPNQNVDPEKLKQQLVERNHPEIQVFRLEDLYQKYELSSSSAIKEKIKKVYKKKELF